jgi:hypothetical protein
MIPKRAQFTMGLAAGVLAVAVLASAQPKDAFVGTWRLNLAKSTYSPGPLRRMTTVYETAGQGCKVSVKIEPASGPTLQWSFTSNLDGKDSSITGDNPNADTAAVKRIDANTLEIVNKKGGKVTTTQKNVVAPDGKTRTVTTTGTDAKGQKVNNVAVREAVAPAGRPASAPSGPKTKA